jgi:hypothetical protein
LGGCLTWARMMPEKAGLASTFSAGIRARTGESCSREPHRTAVLLPLPAHQPGSLCSKGPEFPALLRQQQVADAGFQLRHFRRAHFLIGIQRERVAAALG